MHITKLFDHFRKTNFLLLKINCNADQGSIWFSEAIDPEFIGNKMHIRQGGTDKDVITWFSSMSEGDYTNLRLLYMPEKDVFVISYLNTKTGLSKDIKIDDISTLQDEAVFFQRSTTEDMADLECSDISFMIDLSEKVSSFAKGMIDANKTCSS